MPRFSLSAMLLAATAAITMPAHAQDMVGPPLPRNFASPASEGITILGKKYNLSFPQNAESGKSWADVRGRLPAIVTATPDRPLSDDARLDLVQNLLLDMRQKYSELLTSDFSAHKDQYMAAHPGLTEPQVRMTIAGTYQSAAGANPRIQKAHDSYLAVMYLSDALSCALQTPKDCPPPPRYP